MTRTLQKFKHSTVLLLPVLPGSTGTAEQAAVTIDVSATEPLQQAINKLVNILEGVTVPVRTKLISRRSGNEYTSVESPPTKSIRYK
jgi:hypothetical protein